MAIISTYEITQPPTGNELYDAVIDNLGEDGIVQITIEPGFEVPREEAHDILVKVCRSTHRRAKNIIEGRIVQDSELLPGTVVIELDRTTDDRAKASILKP